MGKMYSCLCGGGDGLDSSKRSTNNSQKYTSSLVEIDKFRSKIEKLKEKTGDDESQNLDILQEALKDGNISDEPVDKYYLIGDAIGSGKFGIVRKATAISNPLKEVVVKTVDLKKLCPTYYTIISEILTMK